MSEKSKPVGESRAGGRDIRTDGRDSSHYLHLVRQHSHCVGDNRMLQQPFWERRSYSLVLWFPVAGGLSCSPYIYTTLIRYSVLGSRSIWGEHISSKNGLRWTIANVNNMIFPSCSPVKTLYVSLSYQTLAYLNCLLLRVVLLCSRKVLEAPPTLTSLMSSSVATGW